MITTFSVVLRLFAVYFLLVSLFAFLKKPVYARRAPKLRFACILAARNEEAVIANAVQSLKEQDYPAELFTIYVMPNNCTDRTEELALQAGAVILPAPTWVRCKGDALHCAFEALLPENYDAFCVFDADNIAAPDFLSRINDAMLSGVDVAKGAMRVSNAGRSSIAGCYGLYYIMLDFFFSRARNNLGLSARLAGTGFCVRRSLLETLGGWNTETFTEDSEFGVQCVTNGFRVSYVPDALTYDEAPDSFLVSLRQRRRWASGVMSVSGRYIGGLFRSARHRDRRWRCIDQIIWLASPFAQVASAFLCVASFAVAENKGQFFLGLLLGAAAGYLGSAMLAGLLLWIGKYPIRKMLRAVFFYPLFVASWLPIQIYSFFFRAKKWQIVRHVGGGTEKKHPAALLPPDANFS